MMTVDIVLWGPLDNPTLAGAVSIPLPEVPGAQTLDAQEVAFGRSVAGGLDTLHVGVVVDLQCDGFALQYPDQLHQEVFHL